MEKLAKVNYNDQRLVLKDKLVESDLLPQSMKELNRDVVIDGESIIQGAVFAHNLLLNSGPLQVNGACYVHNELMIGSDATGNIVFKKSVAAGNSVSCLSRQNRAMFLSDISARKVTLKNVFVAGSILADEIDLESCVVTGGAFATKSLTMKNCVMGTFNTTAANCTGVNYLLMPSAFCIEPIVTNESSLFWNLTTADLASICFGTPETAGSGKIAMHCENDSLPINLFDQADNKTMVRCFSVAGKVMITDMLKLEDLNNHFLMRSATLAGQLEKTFRLPIGELDPQKIGLGLFKLIDGSHTVSELSRTVSLEELKAHLGA